MTVTAAATMGNRISSLGTAVAVAAIGSCSAWAFTYVVKHHVPELWLVWFGSGAVIAGLLALSRPRFWLLATAATVSPLLFQTILAIRDAPPTAAALAAAFAVAWAVMTVLGGIVGRLLAPSSISAASRGTTDSHSS